MMNTGLSVRPTVSFIGFALCLLIPSTGTVQKYFGSPAVAVYLVLGFGILLISDKLIFPKLLSIADKQASFLIVLTFIGLIAVFSVLHPIAQSGTVGGGSDADDALNIAATRLIHGQYPYYAKTYLDNPLAPLPGAVLLATPFVLLGNSAYQNLFWLAAFCFAIAGYLKNIPVALVLLWAMLAFSPTVLANIVTGIDHPANTIYVLLFMWWMMKLIPKSDAAGWKKLLPSVLLGIGLSSRSNFILLLPLLFSGLTQNAGGRPAIKYLTITCLILGAVTIPFWIYDPHAFSPLFQQTNKVGQFRTLLLASGVLIPVVASAIAVALSFQRMSSDCVVFFRNCAIVQAFPVLCVVVLSSLQAGRLNLVLAGYGLFFMIFGVAAYGTILLEKSHPSSGSKLETPATSQF